MKLLLLLILAAQAAEADKARLGKLLYFDKRLSSDKTVSCATCHDPNKGWTDQRPISIGVFHRLGVRNAPTVLNAFRHKSQFWDGRAPTLQAQALEPIANPKEMDMSHTQAAANIAAIKGYRRHFKAAYGDENVTIERIADALAAFQTGVVTGNSPYDRGKLTAEAKRGLELFNGKAKCISCHTGPDLTDGAFHNVGAGMQRRVQDLGRHDVTKKEEDKGAFKTPLLRNLSDTFPYMHDGSLATLEEVVDYFDRGGTPNAWLSPNVKPLGLLEQEKKDLVAFLKSLDGDKVLVKEPKLPQ